MADLWKAVAELAASTHADRIAVVADTVSALASVSEFDQARHAFGPNADQSLVDRLLISWKASPTVTSREVASAFRAAAQVVSLMETRGALELVWTGPKTGLIPTRQTEQVMLEVIDSARSDLFLVSYVFFNTPSIVSALNTAIARGVIIKALLEPSMEHGGTVHTNGIKAMHEVVADASIYTWDDDLEKKSGTYLGSSVHAKCVVADRKLAFITSANITMAALERNMELGVLIRGGSEPERLHDHLEALVKTGIIKPVNY